MYSATLGKHVHQLSKASLTNPEYILLHSKGEKAEKGKLHD